MPDDKDQNEVALSIEETNKLRAELGLKPLQTEGDGEVHAPAPKHIKKKETAQDRADREFEKKAKKTRKDLVSGEGIGSIVAGEDGDEDAAAWAERMRKNGARRVREDDKPKKQKKHKISDETKVAHDMDNIEYGQEQIMVLQDSNLLDEDGNLRDEEDTLHNVRMTDRYKDGVRDAIKNQKDYDPTKEDATMLDKYDDPMAEKPKGFVMGQVKEIDPAEAMKALNQEKKTESLDSKMKVQDDFFNSEEMLKMRRKALKKQKKMKKRKVTTDETDLPAKKLKINPNLLKELDCDSGEEDAELYNQLNRQKKVMSKKADEPALKGEAALAARVVDQLGKGAEQKPDDMKDLDELPSEDAKEMIMTNTSQFAKVVHTPIEKADALKSEGFSGAAAYKASIQARVKRGMAVDPKAKKSKDVEMTAEEEEKLETERKFVDEEVLDGSTGSALQYLRSRQQLGRDQDTHYAKKMADRPMEQNPEDRIKIEYRDEFGRVQTAKEAYQTISWQFHGKKPSLRQQTKRLKQFEQEQQAKVNANTEQADLPTMRALQSVQKSDNKAYIVLGTGTKNE